MLASSSRPSSSSSPHRSSRSASSSPRGRPRRRAVAAPLPESSPAVGDACALIRRRSSGEPDRTSSRDGVPVPVLPRADVTGRVERQAAQRARRSTGGDHPLRPDGERLGRRRGDAGPAARPAPPARRDIGSAGVSEIACASRTTSSSSGSQPRASMPTRNSSSSGVSSGATSSLSAGVGTSAVCRDLAEQGLDPLRERRDLALFHRDADQPSRRRAPGGRRCAPPAGRRFRPRTARGCRRRIPVAAWCFRPYAVAGFLDFSLKQPPRNSRTRTPPPTAASDDALRRRRFLAGGISAATSPPVSLTRRTKGRSSV